MKKRVFQKIAVFLWPIVEVGHKPNSQKRFKRPGKPCANPAPLIANCKKFGAIATVNKKA